MSNVRLAGEPKNQNKRATLGRPAIKLLGAVIEPVSGGGGGFLPT